MLLKLDSFTYILYYTFLWERDRQIINYDVTLRNIDFRLNKQK